MYAQSPPVVLCISGHDPIGGAGVQADIEAVAANGCHACSAITCITVQDTCRVKSVQTLPASQILAQIDAVCSDSPVAIIKIGLLGSAEIAHALAGWLADSDPRPLILDPVLASGAGKPLADSDLIDAVCRELLPFTSLLTPNSHEARRLAPVAEDLDGCAREMLTSGCGQVLITGTHEQDTEVINRLYGREGMVETMQWERLPGSFHGSGCTLASSIAARLALSQATKRPATRSEEATQLRQAVREGQAYTWQALNQAIRIGRCQQLPGRLHRLAQGGGS